MIARLPAAKTESFRSCLWTVNLDAELPGDGTLCIVRGDGVSYYGVEEQYATGQPGRSFLLAKFDAEGTVYETFVGADRCNFRCSCPSGQHRKTLRCVHVEALDAMIRAGHLEDPRGGPTR